MQSNTPFFMREYVAIIPLVFLYYSIVRMTKMRICAILWVYLMIENKVS